jgi:chemotaxis protein MotA
MPSALWTGTLAITVAACILLDLFSSGSGGVAAVAGLGLVCCGTLLMARLSHASSALRSLRQSLREVRRARDPVAAEEQPLHWFLTAANLFRYGKIRPAEDAAREISRPVLRRGTQLVLDGLERQQLTIALQRTIAEERERLVAPVDVLRAMATYAPTLGMLGTLLGLSQMLFGVGTGDVASMGAAMGFAMTTTVYGLVFANLLFKPLAAKIENHNRHELTRCVVDLQAVLLLYERRHPAYIRDMVLGRSVRAASPISELMSAAG